ncbi:mobilization protein [Burkholderia cenocepacia]|uniref:mobilization protein n=1 Tax=Burkholderia cepacia complex TaxID=87882 RepID=UPI000F58E4C3|nr:MULTISPECIES: mobilization protein [Burkholderia cepacia complex]ELW9449221.1 mobilization protein [Burkholderia cenocepacia]MBR8485745.1 mobilization protein [Burkholderia cenocepacia]MDN7472363.1 mobilization protein [Burkholderia orbicola]MDN7507299.1 mobilization protein [Burkholderia orbicola]RQU16674.1 mobilization protein [Burkholderia cenocepacia]
MSHIHFIGGEKGGVGKSLAARVLAQYFIDRSMPFVGFDTDRSHGALLRFYADFAAPAVLDQHDSLDPVMESALEDPQRRILVDLAAQTRQSLAKWLDDSDVVDFAEEHGLTLTWWHVMDTGRDSVDLLRQWLDEFGGRIKLVLVLNEVRGDRFEILEASGERERAEALGASVITLRRLPDTTMQKIDRQSASFWAAVNHPDRTATGLGLLERQRVKVWLHRTYEELGTLAL